MDKNSQYESLIGDLQNVLSEEKDPIAWMSTVSCMIRESLGHFWVGFYRFSGTELVIGPYQGTPGCLRISLGKGVCGACARDQKTIIVPNVHLFPGHIACDSRSNSEIVVPIFDQDRNLRAVLDIDSVEYSKFDEVDRFHLEKIADLMSDLQWTNPK